MLEVADEIEAGGARFAIAIVTSGDGWAEGDFDRQPAAKGQSFAWPACAARACDGSPPRVGDSVALVPGYSPATVNWYDAYHVVRGDVVIDVWAIFPRGPGHRGLSW